MKNVKFDLGKPGIPFKILNGTNGGPWHKRHVKNPARSNFEAYKAARIPFQRTHDSGMVGIYGGPYSYDVSKIFTNFDADVNDPASYDFACTDEAILTSLEAGTQIFFRLGETIEHQIKPRHTLPPKDYKKWAEICEHIIMHYNEGWADGFHHNIEYWEIWAEPDLSYPEDRPDKPTWGGTQAQFFDFFEVSIRHLKARFPHLKIGGPALCFKQGWAEEFFREMAKRNVPMDFFSWHVYCVEPEKMLAKAQIIKDFMNQNGYGDIPSILNEWNYCDFSQQLKAWKTIQSVKGAAFLMACISSAQQCPNIDMLMYYDTRPGLWCGAFDYLTWEPIKGYYPLAWYGKFYEMECDVPCTEAPENIYTLCGVDKDGKVMAVITHYSDEDDVPAMDITVDFGKEGTYEIYRVDSDCDGELAQTTSDLTFNLPVHSFILIKEI